MTERLSGLLGFVFYFLLPGCAAPPSPSVPMISVNAGFIELADDPVGRYGAEYRLREFGSWRIAPAIGFAVSENEAAFIYADLRHDFWLNRHWSFSPRAGVGGFDEGVNFDLGGALEFRTGLEFAHRFNNGMRLGVGLFHLSNANISASNPGTEVAVLSFSLPLH